MFALERMSYFALSNTPLSRAWHTPWSIIKAYSRDCTFIIPLFPTRCVIRIILARRLSQIFRRLHYVLHWIYWLHSDCSWYNVYKLFPIGVGDSRFSDTNRFFHYSIFFPKSKNRQRFFVMIFFIEKNQGTIFCHDFFRREKSHHNIFGQFFGRYEKSYHDFFYRFS